MTKKRTGEDLAPYETLKLPPPLWGMVTAVRDELGTTYVELFRWATSEVLYSLATKEITPTELMNEDREKWWGTKDQRKVAVGIDPLTTAVMCSIEGVTAPAILRKAALVIAEHRDRYTLEKRYLNLGGVGDVRHLSASFMEMWCRSTTGKLSAQDLPRLVSQVTSLTMQIQQLQAQVESLLVTVTDYFPAGVASVNDPPSAATIRSGSWHFLVALCNHNGLRLKNDVTALRAILLQHYGYRFTGP